MEMDRLSDIPDDLLLEILFKLELDPCNWSRLACVSHRFNYLIRNVCWKINCTNTLPLELCQIPNDILEPPDDWWASLYKLRVCCPGLNLFRTFPDSTIAIEHGHDEPPRNPSCTWTNGNFQNSLWSLSNGLYFDTSNACESQETSEEPKYGIVKPIPSYHCSDCKRRKISQSKKPHLASGAWNLSCEDGNKLLANRFRKDCLYICNWPGCLHNEKGRVYKLFRGVFKNFKDSEIWRMIINESYGHVNMFGGLTCVFCTSLHMWDLHSMGILGAGFWYHDDWVRVIRAFVCENGHVSGAWSVITSVRFLYM